MSACVCGALVFVEFLIETTCDASRTRRQRFSVDGDIVFVTLLVTRPLGHDAHKKYRTNVVVVEDLFART